MPEFVSSIELIAREIPGVWDEVRAWGIANADQLPAILNAPNAPPMYAPATGINADTPMIVPVITA